jgi:hypothetical protein
MARFKETDCYIPKIWCGKEDNYPQGYHNDSYYVRTGERHECLRQGIGAGIATAKKHPPSSLQSIKYIGEKYEDAFKKAGIKNTTELKKETKSKTPAQIKKLLEGVLSKKGSGRNKIVDQRAYNSVILYLYRGGITVPKCKKIKEL